MLLDVLEWSLIVLGAVMAGGTALSLSGWSHWSIRGWDFPRLQIAAFLLLSGAPYAVLFFRGEGWQWLFLTVVTAAFVWQASHVLPYTRTWPRRVERSRRGRGPQSFRIVISNVQMENRRFAHWREVVLAEDPDLILAVEVNDEWLRELSVLRERYPHVVAQPQGNFFGMALFSRLPLVEPRVEFLVQEDVPSIHTRVELPSGERIILHGLHPRPPEPVRRQSGKARDAELVVVGRRIEQEGERPSIVAGDLNDVAWSDTTRLFLKLSGMLDPRRGRGMFNSFSANSHIWRFPLDHVFHSNDFRLVDLRLLEHVGSDHFPVFVELSHEPDAERAQPEPEADAGDREDASEKIDRQVEDERDGEDAKGQLREKTPAS